MDREMTAEERVGKSLRVTTLHESWARDSKRDNRGFLKVDF